MTRRTLLALAAAALAGCPLPQPLPDYPPGTITPPRIIAASATRPAESIIPVPAGCAEEPVYPLDARIHYQEAVAVEARWFVDYKNDVASRFNIQNATREVPPDPDPTVLERDVPTFTFSPYDYPPPAELGLGGTPWSSPGVVHVVELVVSNGFDPNPEALDPNRTPAVNGLLRFEVETFRWVFVNVAGPSCP
jgi:hypothetical protein